MSDTINVRFRDDTHKITSAVTLYESDDFMTRMLGHNMEKVKEEIIDKIKRIAEESNISEFTLQIQTIF